MKRLPILLLCIVLLFISVACNNNDTHHPDSDRENQSASCSHIYKDATCIMPKICTKCGKTEGNALGHNWMAATCAAPKTCYRCGKTEGNAGSHSWKNATCIDPKTCSVCKATEGKANGHNYVNEICTICGTDRSGLKENSRRVLNYLKENHGKLLTSEDVANALDMEKRSVDGIFTAVFQANGLGIRIPAEIKLDDGTYKQVKYLQLTNAGLVY